MILVTGGAGFIGTNFILDCLKYYDDEIINLDKLTYASNLENFESTNGDRLRNIQIDINQCEEIYKIICESKPRLIFHFAAESHVDRSINSADEFIASNINGTYQLLKATNQYFHDVLMGRDDNFRFMHISTDEVFGALSQNDDSFSETSRYMPNSPYAASKASSDHIVRAFNQTYNLPTIITNCSNNFGPFQSPEKLIPKIITSCMKKKPIPIYGDGMQIRDWLYVGDHTRARLKLSTNGDIGESYCIGGGTELSNLFLTKKICSKFDEIKNSSKNPSDRLITFVEDRKGHDFRYSIDSSKLKKTINWNPSNKFDELIEKTILWYLNNEDWVLKMLEKH